MKGVGLDAKVVKLGKDSEDLFNRALYHRIMKDTHGQVFKPYQAGILQVAR